MSARNALFVTLTGALCSTAWAGSALAERAQLRRAGVVFTFDDAFVTEWVAAMPVFSRHGARATFFVSAFDRLGTERVDGLRALAAAGHAIGCHGLRHLSAAKEVAKSSVEAYVAAEIEPAVKLMREAGFSPTSFAYPCSNRSEATDRALAPYFRHLRTGTGVKADRGMARTDAMFTRLAEVGARHCLVGTGIDYAGTEGHPERSLSAIFAALDRARERGEIVVFYAHNISEKGPGHHIRPEALEAILGHAEEAGLAFYTYDDLP